jgi:hypothetical protein
MVIKDKNGIPDVLGLASETARTALLPLEDWTELYNDIHKTYRDLEELNSLPEKFGWRIVEDPETKLLVGINDELKLTIQGESRKELVECIIEALELRSESYRGDLEEFYKKKKSNEFLTSLVVLWGISTMLLASIFKNFSDNINFLIPTVISLPISFLLAKKLNKKN